MIEGIEHVHSKLQLHLFLNCEILEDREINITDARQLECIASRIGERSRASTDVLCIWIIRDVGNYLASRVR